MLNEENLLHIKHFFNDKSFWLELQQNDEFFDTFSIIRSISLPGRITGAFHVLSLISMEYCNNLQVEVTKKGRTSTFLSYIPITHKGRNDIGLINQLSAMIGYLYKGSLQQIFIL